jgi:hypothetical protein
MWTYERIAQLSTDEIRSLCKNARDRSAEDVALLCEKVLATKKIDSRQALKQTDRRQAKGDVNSFTDEASIHRLAEIIRQLPAAEECANVQNRRRRQANAQNLTLAVLWRIYLDCAFSSQEKSGPTSNLAKFTNGQSGLLDLTIVSQRNADEAWVRSEIETAGFRFTDTKTKIACSTYALFAELGEPSKLLKELPSSDSRAQAHSPMALFYDLAKNKLSDKDIHLSAKFSADIDHKPFYGLGPKQIRNILVNSGLAFNVVPLDSRWKKFLEDGAGIIIDGNLGQLNYYLQVEEVLRKALLVASEQRADIPNLATLDAIVFSTFD